MDHGFPVVIYFDPRARRDQVIAESDLPKPSPADAPSPKTRPLRHEAEIERNLRALLVTFPHVHLCRSAPTCLQKVEDIQSTYLGVPVVLVVHVSPDQERQAAAVTRKARSPSPYSVPGTVIEQPELADLAGLSFLRHVTSEKSHEHALNYATLVALLEAHDKADAPAGLLPAADRGRAAGKDGFRSHAHYFQAGAVDVMQSPLSPERIQCLPAHAYRTAHEYRAHQPELDSDSRRNSFAAGQNNDSKPYAYLRESMVSGLMDRICDPSYFEKAINIEDLHVVAERKPIIAAAIGTWGFSAHDFSDDELTYASFLILKHTLLMPGLEKWQLSDDGLLMFLLACRRVYNSFVIYHNFRHACDVLQATFCFLLSIQALAPYPAVGQEHDRALDGTDHAQSLAEKTPLASLVRPFEAMTLIISAVGHDVGHPGVNNLFLVTLNAPLAQLYNDRSVLESFHCAAFSQILRRYWPAAFSDVALRKLMINTILATDMSVHSNYINDLDKLNDKIQQADDYVGDLVDGPLSDTRTLLCCLLIKCADISNVARKFPVASEWAEILTEEFANQGNMESELDMPSCLFGGPPVLHDIVKMGASQIGFMNIFGIPLFQKMSKALPGMKFTVDELESNRATWQKTMEDAKNKSKEASVVNAPTERTHSPHQNRRGSVIAHSHMRSDPMVFGAHSSLGSPRAPKRHSAGSNSQLSSAGLPSSRRASLGPTVIPQPHQSTHSASRRSSATQGKIVAAASGRLTELQGLPSPVVVEGSRPLDGSSEYNTLKPSPKAGGASVDRFGIEPTMAELLKNPPPFILKDPSTAHSDEDPPDLTIGRRRHSAGSVRGREKAPAATRVDSTEDSLANSSKMSTTSQRRSRKFTLKFWRKSRSMERSRDAQ